ncbi:hypothetical protein FACS1894217_14140 [Clostridia bacterium]|nr:hypothetical protein FACS1894217_14140 [Clostridia bacterium]
MSIHEPQWPTVNDQPEPPVFILTLKNPTDIASTTSLLHGCGIPTLTQSTMRKHFTTVIFGGDIHGADLFVPESLAEDAAEILNTRGTVDYGDSVEEL